MGYVSAYGTEYAETCSGINGFALGVQAVNPDATVYVKELGNWFDEVNEYAFAEELINSYNCGVIAQHCDSAQPQLAAEKAGVFGCGYNSDMTKDAPNAHLTAPVWNWDVYYKLAIETAMACEGDASQFVEKMGGEAWYGGLAEGYPRFRIHEYDKVPTSSDRATNYFVREYFACEPTGNLAYRQAQSAVPRFTGLNVSEEQLIDRKVRTALLEGFRRQLGIV